MDEKQKETMKILLAGPGAVGGIVAAAVQKAGYSLMILTHTEETARILNEKGLEITGVKGNSQLSVRAVAKVSELKDRFDLLLLATKAYDVLPLLSALGPYMNPDCQVVSLQNGMVEEKMAERIGEERTIACVVGWGATLHAPGRMEMTSGGEFVIGRLNGRKDEAIQTCAEVLSNVVPVECSDNIRGNLYSKLIINSCITSLGALTGTYLGEMLAARSSRKIFIRIIYEAMEVAMTLGIEVAVYAGKLNYYRFISWKGCLGSLRRHFLIRMIGIKYRRLKSSSLQSLERGRPTEIGYLNGYIVDKAAEQGLSVPVNARLVEMIRDIESGKRSIAPSNLEELIRILK